MIIVEMVQPRIPSHNPLMGFQYESVKFGVSFDKNAFHVITI